MAQSVSRALFDRYVLGSVSAAEVAAVQQWLAQPANQLVAQHWMHQHWHELNDPAAAHNPRIGEPDYEAMLRSLHQRLDLDATPMLTRLPPSPRRVAVQWRRWAAAAAITGALAGAGWLGRPYLAPPTSVAATTTYTTPYGRTRLVRLPDGSRVTLNAHSTLRYAPAVVAGQPREAWLDGEGYFEVRHQTDNRRFVVHTSAGLDVEVLGTCFSVYRRHEQARVVLVSGKVRVSFADQRQADVIMQPGDVVETGAAQAPSREVVRRVVPEPETYAAWKDGKLVLNETTIGELTTRLQDTYGLRVEVKNPALNQRRITGTVPIRDLDVLLLALQESFNLRVERQPGRIILSDNRASKPAL
ncbi:MAG: FecR domain-containing protein [Hymenobacteraceae bacterium]|nr:FecR domain-containing protein [Hymenobacteraceae bacterium]